MVNSSTRYEPVPNPTGEPAGDEDLEEADELQFDELEPLAPNGRSQLVSDREASASRARSASFLRSLFGVTSTSDISEDRLVVAPFPTTPISSDGVFTNIPAKPSSSRDRSREDEELGEEEWIFMTPEQRLKLSPPKYSRIKRDRAPRYTTEYTPPPLPQSPRSRKPRQAAPLRPRVNSLPSGSSAVFVATALFTALVPLLGFSVIYIIVRGRWMTHATRLGSRTGLGMGLFHIGAMIAYIPALVSGPRAFTVSSLPIPLTLSLLWTVFIGFPFGWRLARDSVREYMWVKAQERVLVERILRENLNVATSSTEAEEEEEDIENGYRYIEGTDIRVRDLKKILARARDARLARSLRSAGF